MISSKISFVLPAKNEESTIENVLNEIINISKKIDTNPVGIVVASDSIDNTDQICKKFEKYRK